MDFALYPKEGGYPRLWRYVEDEHMTEMGIVTTLDAKQNLLRINRPLFDQLSPAEQNIVLRTHRVTEYV